MIATHTISFGSLTLVLNTERSIYIPSQKTLILSDLHLGKAAHFRKHGIPIPATIVHNDLKRLKEVILDTKAENVIIAGDFFHASNNSELDLFKEWKKAFTKLNWILIRGNHDRWKTEEYQALNFELHKKDLFIEDVCITHEPSKNPTNWEISGHIHPGISLYGIGKQKIKTSCFVQHKKQLILPAFSHFTGLDTHFTRGKEQVYAIAPDAVVPIF